MENDTKLIEINEILSRILNTKIELKSVSELYDRFIYKLNNEVVIQIAIPIIESLKDDVENCKNVWKALDSEIQIQIGNEVIDMISDNKNLFSEIWDATNVVSQESIKTRILEKFDGNDEFLLEFYLGASEKIQNENKELIPELVEYIRSAPNSDKELLYFWNKLNSELQLENDNIYEEVLYYVINSDSSRLLNLWTHTDSQINKKHPEIHRDVIEQLHSRVEKKEKFISMLVYPWMFGGFSKEIQREYLPIILENNENLIDNDYWLSELDYNLVNEFFVQIITKVSKFEDIWHIIEKVPENTIEENFEILKEKFKSLEYSKGKEVFWNLLPEKYRTLDTFQSILGKNIKAIENMLDIVDYNFIVQNHSELLVYIDSIEIDNSDENYLQSVKNGIIEKIIISIPQEIQNENTDNLIKYAKNIDAIKNALIISSNLLECFIKENDVINTYGNYMFSTKFGEKYEIIEKTLPILLNQTKDESEYNKVLDALVYELRPRTSDSYFDERQAIDAKNMEEHALELLKVCYEKAKSNPEYLKVFIKTIPSSTQQELGSNIEINANLLWPESEEFQKQDFILRYNDLKKYNKDIDTTVDFDFLSSNLYKCFSVEQLGRITSDSEFQKSLLKYNDNPIMLNAIRYIAENGTNWVIELDKILRNIDKYHEILSIDYSQEMDSPEYIKNFINILSGRENYFEITSKEDIINFEKNKKEICKKILNNELSLEEIRKIMHRDEAIDINDAKKFAYLEMIYGMDLQDAKNLVMKYGKDIDKINLSSDLEVYRIIINDLKNILECKDFSDLNEIDRTVNLISTANVEANLLNIYAKTYRDVVFSVEEDKSQFLKDEWNGNEISILEMNPDNDFAMFARVEGAYVNWEEPENFLDAINIPSTKYHGNCKSFIAQNMLAVARPKGPIWGYSNIPENSLLLGAPWDIISAKANEEFSTASVEWEFKNGISFRTPKEMVDATRHGHNEFVSDRLMFNKDKMQYEKDKPQYVIYFKETTNEDYKSSELWEMTKKAASQVGVPIVIIDKEKVIEKQYEKLNELKDILVGKKENTTNLTDNQIIERLVVEFENNRVGVNFSEALKDKYFTQIQRKEMFDIIIEKINSYKDTNFEKYNELRNAYINAMENEISKQFSTTGATIGDKDTINNFIANLSHYKQGKLDLNLDENTQEIVIDFIKNISKTDFYDDSINHSIEHIQKVILFSGLLAKYENLTAEQTKLLLISAAFHDSGRKENDWNAEHAEASALQIREYFENHPNNPFGITNDNLGLIQVAIHYHEYDEPNKNKVDIEKLKELCAKYNVDENKLDEVKKISILLKDADALDRFRFLKYGGLKAEYLHSETAKNKDMINYAYQINRKFLIEKFSNILVNFYGVDKNKITPENMLELLKIEREKRVNLGLESKYAIETFFEDEPDISKREPKLSLENLLKIYGLDKVRCKYNKSKLDVLKKQYKINRTSLSSVIEIGKSIEAELNIDKEQAEEYTDENLDFKE